MCETLFNVSAVSQWKHMDVIPHPAP